MSSASAILSTRPLASTPAASQSRRTRLQGSSTAVVIPRHDAATERRILALGDAAISPSPLAASHLRGSKAAPARPFARDAFTPARAERDYHHPAATGGGGGAPTTLSPTPYQLVRRQPPRSRGGGVDSGGMDGAGTRPDTRGESNGMGATHASSTGAAGLASSASFARRLMALRPESRATQLSDQDDGARLAAARPTSPPEQLPPVHGHTIPLAAYFAAETSDVSGTLAGLGRPLSPQLLAMTSSNGDNRDGGGSPHRRPASQAAGDHGHHGGGVIDRALLFSRERLQNQDRAALRSRAKTPAEIGRWHDQLPVSHVQQRIRSKKTAPPAEQLAARLEERVQRLLSAHLDASGVRFHEPRSSAVALASTIGGAHSHAEELLEAERRRRVEAAMPAKRRGKNAVHSVVRTVAVARMAAGVAPTAAVSPSTSTKSASQVARERIAKLRQEGGSEAAAAEAALQRAAEEARAAAEEARLLQQRRFTETEAVAILNQFYRIDELGIGSANIRDVTKWCELVFERPIDRAVAATILDRESGVVTLPRYCALVRPNITPEDAAVSLQLALARKPPNAQKSISSLGGLQRRNNASRMSPKAGGGNSSPSAAAGELHASPSHRGVAVARLQRQHQASASASASPNANSALLAMNAAPPAVATPLTIIDRRRWMALTDAGLVRTLRDMYLAERGGDVRGVSRARYLRRFRRVMVRAELDAAFDAADVDRDGWLCFEEFARVVWRGVSAGSPFPVPPPPLPRHLLPSASSPGLDGDDDCFASASPSSALLPLPHVASAEIHSREAADDGPLPPVVATKAAAHRNSDSGTSSNISAQEEGGVDGDNDE